MHSKKLVSCNCCGNNLNASPLNRERMACDHSSVAVGYFCIQALQIIQSAETTRLDLGKSDQLVCKCLAEERGVVGCRKGHDVLMSPQYWGGDVSSSQLEPYNPLTRVQIINNFTEEEERLAADKFATSLCFFDLCKRYSESVLSYSLQTTDPCRDDLHRRGLICTRCQDGYSLTATVDFV